MLSFLLCLVSSKIQLSLTEERQFLQWMRINNKIYTGDEYHFRLGIFISNARYCYEFNKRKGLTFKVGTNQFSHLTLSEYKTFLGAKTKRNKSTKITSNYKSAKYVPETFDWRDKGVISPIKVQGHCGSCCPFSTISTSESAFAISTGNLLQFSEQNLVDCVRSCNGCDCGDLIDAFTYIIEKQGGQFNSESDYPYTASAGTCTFDQKKAVGRITDVIEVVEDDENDLKEKVANFGVASVLISAGNSPFMLYTGGILDDEDCVEFPFADHAVSVVGYGSENGVDFWIVRNSWGETWGEDGYVRMIRNKESRCLIASDAYIAIDKE